MTWLGKILVFVALAISLLLLAWAAGLYTNRIDWTLTKGTAEKPDGEGLKRQERFKQLTGALQVAEARLRAARPVVVRLENFRPKNLEHYAKVLAAARGNQGNKEAQVQAVVFQNGQPVLEPPNVGVPKMEPAKDRTGGPLLTMAHYEEALAQVAQAIDKEQKRYQKAIAEDKELTEQIVGEKGLRQQVWDETAKGASVSAEVNDLKGRRVNTLMDTEILHQRRDQMRARIAELKKTRPVADRP
jgi:hypothetical protein